APDGVSGVDSRTKISTSERNRFAAFEQISRSKRATHLSDIYSLGAVLYHMLTGLYPNNVFDRIDMGDGLMVAPAMQNTADLPPALIPILNKMMEIKQFNRFPDLPAVSAAMNNAKLINLRLKSLDPPKPAATKKKGLNKGLLIGMIVAVLGMIGAAVVAVALVIFLILPKLNAKPAPKPDTEQTESGQTTEGEQQPDDEKPNEDKPNEDKPNEGGLLDLPKPDGEEPEDSEAKPSIGILTDETRWMANVIDPDLYVKSSKACFGNKSISKVKIRFVKVLDTIEDATDDAWDISEKQDGGVLAWIEKNSKGQATLYIAGDGGVSAGDSCANMFYGYEMLQEVTFDGNFHTEQVVTMSGMFRNCEGLESVDLSGITTKSVTDFSRMFEGCESLTEADFDEFNTLKGLDFSRMFYGCSSVKTLDLSSFDTAAATTMEKMFYGCKKLSTLKIPHFFASTTTNVSGMFGKCKALKSIDTTSTKILKEFE
ncbi:MAG: BspA family leucine-rich repeat surface protein, partial [Clostridia bacterium]|nr:BspA family leucine-rich repeat surface protein [Clostridia bacterium]